MSPCTDFHRNGFSPSVCVGVCAALAQSGTAQFQIQIWISLDQSDSAADLNSGCSYRRVSLKLPLFYFFLLLFGQIAFNRMKVSSGNVFSPRYFRKVRVKVAVKQEQIHNTNTFGEQKLRITRL